MSDGWIGVDLDGTLAEYDRWRGEGHIGNPILAMIARVKQWLTEGRDVRIFTARVAACGEGGPSGLDNAKFAYRQRLLIEEWSKKHIGVRLEVTATKDFQMIELWDDRCVQVETNTGRRMDDYTALAAKLAELQEKYDNLADEFRPEAKKKFDDAIGRICENRDREKALAAKLAEAEKRNKRLKEERGRCFVLLNKAQAISISTCNLDTAVDELLRENAALRERAEKAEAQRDVYCDFWTGLKEWLAEADVALSRSGPATTAEDVVTQSAIRMVFRHVLDSERIHPNKQALTAPGAGKETK